MDILNLMTESFDLPVLDWIAEYLHCAALDRIMPLITALGDAGLFWILVAAAMLFHPKYRKTGLCISAALIMGVLLCNLTLKPLVARIRPYEYQLLHFGKTIPLLIAAPGDFSFPSGHTIASFEAAVVIFCRHRRAGIATLLLAGMIAFSRLYLYVHYPTDVLASIVLGTAIALLSVKLTPAAIHLYTRKTSR